MNPWIFVAMFGPGVAFIVWGNVLMFRAGNSDERQQNARIIILGFTLLYAVSGVGVALLVLTGYLHPAALVGAFMLLGFALLRGVALRAP